MAVREEDVAAFEKTLDSESSQAAREVVAALVALAGAGSVLPRHVYALVEREDKNGASPARLALCKKIGDAWIAFRASAPLPPQVVQALAEAKVERGKGFYESTWFKAINAALAVLLLFGLRVGARTFGRSCVPGSSERSSYDPRDLSFDQGDVQTKLPEGWKAEHGDPAFRQFGPGLFTSRVAKKDDGTIANLGVPYVEQTRLPKKIDDDALLDAVFEPFKEQVHERLHLATEWSRAECEIEDRGWIVCGGAATSRHEPMRHTVYLHVKRFGDRYLVAIFMRSNEELPKQETIDFVKVLDL